MSVSEGETVYTNLLIIAAGAFLYTLFILVVWKGSAKRSRAMQVSPETMEINFALREGHTIVGVIDTAEGMCFIIGNDVRNEKSYE